MSGVHAESDGPDGHNFHPITYKYSGLGIIIAHFVGEQAELAVALISVFWELLKLIMINNLI